MRTTTFLSLILLIILGCKKTENKLSPPAENSFEYAVNFLQKYQPVTLIKGEDTLQQIAICPGYQARVMTSTFNGGNGLSLGWINFKFIKENKISPHINPYGGEERLWLGPEGGQYSLFFKPGSEFVFDSWQVPAAIDTEPFYLQEMSGEHATYGRRLSLINYQGFTFNFDIKRTITILNKNEVLKFLPQDIFNEVKWVGYKSENTVTNVDSAAWTKEKGLISIWTMGMFPANDSTTAYFPFKRVNDAKVNDAYFKKLSSERLKISDSTVLFKVDGKYRSKIGLNKHIAKNVMGSYDGLHNVLTLIFFEKPDGDFAYVNSLWEKQAEPFNGDVVNSYNDGLQGDSIPEKGTFYELESSSPGLELKPHSAFTHTQYTLHLSGDVKVLNEIALKILNTNLIHLP